MTAQNSLREIRRAPQRCGSSAGIPRYCLPIALREFPNSGRVITWWEDTPAGVRLRKHEQKPEYAIDGQLNVGDLITAISDESGFHEIDELTDANAVDRLLRGRPDSVVEMHLIDRDDNERIVRQKRQLRTTRTTFSEIEFTKGREKCHRGVAGRCDKSVGGRRCQSLLSHNIIELVNLTRWKTACLG